MTKEGDHLEEQSFRSTAVEWLHVQPQPRHGKSMGKGQN